jgi:hypothetical protein
MHKMVELETLYNAQHEALQDALLHAKEKMEKRDWENKERDGGRQAELNHTRREEEKNGSYREKIGLLGQLQVAAMDREKLYMREIE